MNERIKELAAQADFGGVNKGVVVFDRRLEKFAQLIVMECMTICEDLGDQGLDGHYCADKINKTFRS